MPPKPGLLRHVLLKLLLALSGWAGMLGGCVQRPTEGPTLVAGQVVESQTRQPVSGAAVQVYQAAKGGGYAPVGRASAADAGGHFSFHFGADSKTTAYLLRATAPPGYFTDWSLAPNLLAGRKNTGLVVPVLAPAWVRLQLVDEPPKSRVSLFVSGYEGSGDRLNSPRDTTLIRPSLGGFVGKIIWVITDEQGHDTQYAHDVRLAALDTLTVRIPF